MKTLLLFTLALLVSVATFGQSETPFKKANTIIVQTSQSQEAMLKSMVVALMDRGYGIQSVDKDLGIITTTAKGLRNGSISLNAHVREQEVVLRGNLHLTAAVSNVVANAPIPIEYKGTKTSPLMRAWDEMGAVARSLPSAKVLYR